MTATLAPRPWHPAPAPRRGAAWRIGRVRAAGAGWVWDLRRNVSLTPRQMLRAFGLLSALALIVAAGFWSQGVPLVAAFTGIELVALGAAVLVSARHAGDRELITLDPRELTVEQHHGHTVVRTLMRSAWVRVEPAAGEGSLVELSGEGRAVRVGRHLRPELRGELAQELRRALRATRRAGGQPLNHEPQA